MTLKKKMKKENLTDKQLYSAGATVRHKSPFDNLESYENQVEITQAFREEWVIPFYFELKNQSEEWIEKMISIKYKITEDVILQNLGDFDWRTRSMGSYFASILDSKQLTNIIGTHLLKSEVCFAGSQYAITLASFNTVEATEYLNKYLNYYLKNFGLDFDQFQVMSAIKYLDELNGSKHIDLHSSQWSQFRDFKIQKIEKSIKDFENQNANGMAEAFKGHLEYWKTEVTSEPVVAAISTINKIKNG